MKKYLAIIMCAGLLLTATGCGDKQKVEDGSNNDTKVPEKAKNKVLSCRQSDENDADTSIEYTFTYDSKGESFSKAILKFNFKLLDEDDKEAAESFCDYYKEDDDTVKTCNSKVTGDKFSATIDIDIDKIDEDDAFTQDTPIDELKELLEDEDSGVTCKIEEK